MQRIADEAAVAVARAPIDGADRQGATRDVDALESDAYRHKDSYLDRPQLGDLGHDAVLTS
jgi:hypothetical protein